MRQLSQNDALFLSSDSAHSSSNISLIQIYDPSTAPGGNVFFKLTGPEKTVSGAEKPFRKLLDGLKK